MHLVTRSRVRSARARCVAPLFGLLVALATPHLAASDDARPLSVARTRPVEVPPTPAPDPRAARSKNHGKTPAGAPAAARPAAPTAIDPRVLDYRRRLEQIAAAKDSAASAEDARARRTVIESVAGLGALDEDLARLERVLADQSARLDSLERDLTGRRQTAIAIVLTGYPKGAGPGAIALTLADGVTVPVPLSEASRASLRAGGAIEAFHGMIEPREQTITVLLSGEGWPAADAGAITLTPARDRLTLLRLDLAELRPATGATGIRASAREEPAGRSASAD